VHDIKNVKCIPNAIDYVTLQILDALVVIILVHLPVFWPEKRQWRHLFTLWYISSQLGEWCIMPASSVPDIKDNPAGENGVDAAL
jgi:hypothetical protein